MLLLLLLLCKWSMRPTECVCFNYENCLSECHRNCIIRAFAKTFAYLKPNVCICYLFMNFRHFLCVSLHFFSFLYLSKRVALSASAAPEAQAAGSATCACIYIFVSALRASLDANVGFNLLIQEITFLRCPLRGKRLKYFVFFSFFFC